MIKKFFLSILLSILICSSAYSQVSWQKFSYFRNWGGLNDDLSSTEVEDNEATDIQNIIFDTGGVIKKRFGTGNIPNASPTGPLFKLNTSATGITGLAFYKQNSGSKHIVAIANVNGKATGYKKTYDSSGSLPQTAWDNIDFSGLPSAHNNNRLSSFSIAEDNLIITMPAETPVKPFRWNATSAIFNLTSDTDCPTASINVYHKNHLFLTGNTTYPSRIFYSNLNDITLYEALDFFDVSTSDGSQVRGLISAYDSLYIFKDYSIWRLSGNDRDSFVLEKMVDKIGTLSHQSLQIVNNLIYFVTADGDIGVYDGNYTVKFISSKIRNTVSDFNKNRTSQIIGLPFSTYKFADYDYYISDSSLGSNENNSVLVFDTSRLAWLKFKGIVANAWAVADDNNNQKMLVFGGYDGYIRYYPTTSYFDGNDATAAISAFYQTKWFRYPEVALGDKKWRLLKVYSLTETTSSILYVDCRSDFEASGSVVSLDLFAQSSLWDVALWDVDSWGGQNLTIKRSEINKGNSLFQLKFYNNTVNQRFSIIGFENFIEPTDRI